MPLSKLSTANREAEIHHLETTPGRTLADNEATLPPALADSTVVDALRSPAEAGGIIQKHDWYETSIANFNIPFATALVKPIGLKKVGLGLYERIQLSFG